MILKGKTVLVTGGSKGIGKACVEAFAKEGANVIINYARDDMAAQDVVNEVTKFGVQALAVKADISNQEEIDAMFERIKKEFQSIDVLLNNAGIAMQDGSQDIRTTEKIFRTVLFGSARVTKAAREIMKEGKIIFISSIHGKMGHGRPDVIGYSASKAALESYMKNLAKEVAPEILVNAIAPGRTLTPGWGEMTEEKMEQEAGGHLIQRWIKPEEIADGALFLAKNDAVCGEVLVIDGGMSLKTLG